MKFPGKRKNKHYFPVSSKRVRPDTEYFKDNKSSYIVGIDQSLVDIEAEINEEFLERYQLTKGQSLLIGSEKTEEIYLYLKENNLVISEHAGGTIGNTLHNYSVLADDISVLLGVMCENIKIGSYAYRYLCGTSSNVDMSHLQPVPGAIGRCITLITPDRERTFVISPGYMNQLSPESIPKKVIQNASALAISAYLLRIEENDPIGQATLQAVKYAKEAGVPVVLTLGTKFLIEAKKAEFRDFIEKYVNVLAMNEDEGEALTGEKDPLLSSEAALDLCDMVLTTAGAEGLYLSGYCDKTVARKTSNPIKSAAISDFNQYEFSRPMLKTDCEEPMKIYAHIDPYMGGPEVIKNTNGAGDAALSALLHDMASNHYHSAIMPTSSKHNHYYLTYSSFAQVCKYSNRASYEVLAQSHPRLSKGLPEKEDSLEESYWER